MTVFDFLARLRDLQVRIAVDGDRLLVRGPEGAVTPELRAELAEHKPELLQLLASSRMTPASAGIPRQPRDRALPASFAQQRLWILYQLQPDNPAYNLRGAVRLIGALDVAALERSLAAIVARHDTLRTRLQMSGARELVQILDAAPVELRTVDFSHIDRAEAEREVRRYIDQEAVRPFDLSRGPLLRPSILRIREDEHVLMFVLHHVVADGWSLALLPQELGALYAAFVGGRPSPLPELPIQYADFAVWQRDRLQGELLERQREYWRGRIGDAPTLQVPTDRARPAVPSLRGAVEIVTLPRDDAGRLKVLCQQEGVTLFMIMLAAMSALMSRYSGQTDVVIGSPIANRTDADLEGLIGFFVNSLVMRTDVSGDPTVRQLLGRVREVALGAYAHQDLPFERLVEELQPERELNRNPLFQVMLAVQNLPPATLDLPGVRLETYDAGIASTRLDLEVYVRDLPDAFLIAFVYSTDLFDAATIRRMQRHLCELLRGMANAPDAKVGDLSILGADERRQVVEEWNATARPYPQIGLAAAFEQQASRAPNATAVEFGDASLTYAELNARANQIAHYLRRQGIREDTLVGVCLDQSLELVATLVGIVKAGGAYVPLDPSYPAERLAFMMKDARLSVVVCEERLRSLLGAPSDVLVVSLEGDAAAIAAQPVMAPDVTVGPDHLAYVIYTSGSTGTPKGVAVTHRSIARLVCNTNYISVTAQDRIALASNSAFDAATFELWGALLHGATLVGIHRDVALSPQALARDIADKRISALFLTTALFNQISHDVPTGFRTLRTLMFGGEAVDPTAVRRVLQAGPPDRLLHVYGPTETTTFATWQLVTDVAERAQTIPIGQALSNTTLYVLDARLEPVPIGAVGELYIGGAGVARGYLHRPELTAERFVPAPFGSVPGARLYRTGDLVRWRADASLEFIGRIDDQVKIRGFRIEPGEIDAALKQHPLVQDAIVLARDDGGGDRRLIAYVVPQTHADAPAEGDPGREEEQVARWRQVYDTVIYEGVAVPAPSDDPTFNITGWTSSYTGLPIPPEAMREQVEQTVARIAEHRPRRVLEIGCGTGLLLFRLLRQCERYVGTDFSPISIEYVARNLSAADRARVELHERLADDFTGFEAAAFDAVVLNSVVQYFPGIDYLLRVLEGAIRVTKPGGWIFLGDLRNFALLEAFHVAVQVHRAADGLPLERLRQRIGQHVEQEQELLVAPALFAALAARWPVITGVRVQPKRGAHRHELSEFRYDVSLEVAGERAAHPVVEWSDWQDGWTVEDLERQLVDKRPAALALRGVPNARVAGYVTTRDAVRDGAASTAAGIRAAAATARGIDPEALWTIGRAQAYVVDISWASSRSDGSFDVLFRRRDAMPAGDATPAFPTAAPTDAPWTAFANDPVRGTVARALVPQLRSYLAERLPDYMVPSAFILLPALPLTPNGKVDRRALPEPDRDRPQQIGAFGAPRNGVEEVVAEVWRTVLGLEQIGIHDNFFDLGGHSLAAIRVVSQVRDLLQVDLEIKSLFERPTVAGLVEGILEGALAQAASAPAASP